MGMFDYIKCEMPLPDAPKAPNVELFQTKDTDDQFLTVYTITKDGRLTWKPYTIETVPKELRPYPNDDGMLGTIGIERRVEGEPVDVNYHGDLEFYEYLDETREWWEYRARFTDGKCDKIELVSYEIVLRDDNA